MASSVAQAAVEQTVLEATKVIEEQLDAEIDRLENLDDEELERLRYVRSMIHSSGKYVYPHFL